MDTLYLIRIYRTLVSYIHTLAFIFLNNKTSMKTLGLITLILTILTLGCQQTKNKENIATVDSVSNDQVETQDEIDNEELTDNDSKPKDLDKFEVIFKIEDNKIGFKQRLGVTWLTNDSIEFRLISEDGICDTGYWGNAKNNHPGMDPESDEDENGDSYPSSEYVKDNDSYTLRIRISLDRDKAKIMFKDKSGEDTDCIPYSDKVMSVKNER